MLFLFDRFRTFISRTTMNNQLDMLNECLVRGLGANYFGLFVAVDIAKEVSLMRL